MQRTRAAGDYGGILEGRPAAFAEQITLRSNSVERHPSPRVSPNTRRLEVQRFAFWKHPGDVYTYRADGSSAAAGMDKSHRRAKQPKNIRACMAQSHGRKNNKASYPGIYSKAKLLSPQLDMPFQDSRSRSREWMSCAPTA